MVYKVVATVAKAHVTQEAKEEDSHYQEDNVAGHDHPPINDIEFPTETLIVFADNIEWYQSDSKCINENVDGHEENNYVRHRPNALDVRVDYQLVWVKRRLVV